MSASRGLPGVRAGSRSAFDDIVGDRTRLVRVGMLAVLAACSVFAVARGLHTWSTGRLTPWWANAGGALVILGLWAWFRRDPVARSTVAGNVTAIVASAALLVPLAYGMTSSIWWLSLVGFAGVLMGRRREALGWGAATVLLVAVAAVAEPFVQVEGAAGEPEVERVLARAVYTVLLLGMAAGFRSVADDRAVALAEGAAALERANAARSRFLAHISHDLRTPLHGTIAMTDVALGGALPEEAREQLVAAQESSRLLLGLLNNVLDVTRAESGALTLDAAPFDLEEAVTSVLGPFARQARSRGLIFTAVSDGTVVTRRIGDRFRFTQVLLNLLGNALKFTGEGRIGVTLRQAVEGEDWVVLEVEDSGSGIPADQQSRIFEPFRQSSPAPGARPQGSGLGLAIAREIARLMGGDVTVASQGRGSRFTALLRLPVGSVATRSCLRPDLLAGPSIRPRAAEPARHEPLRTLVCEDDPISRAVAELMLRRLGHEPMAVGTAEDALLALRSVDFELLLTDIELPGMDGVALARTVRAEEESGLRSRLRIVATTAHVGPDERRRLLDAGFDEHLPKPFDLGAMESVLDAVRSSRTAPLVEV